MDEEQAGLGWLVRDLDTGKLLAAGADFYPLAGETSPSVLDINLYEARALRQAMRWVAVYVQGQLLEMQVADPAGRGLEAKGRGLGAQDRGLGAQDRGLGAKDRGLGPPRGHLAPS